jgi:hypothetical protein
MTIGTEFIGSFAPTYILRHSVTRSEKGCKGNRKKTHPEKLHLSTY